jgi:hypothetical protein
MGEKREDELLGAERLHRNLKPFQRTDVGTQRKRNYRMTTTDQAHINDRADDECGDNSEYVSEHGFFESRA